MRRIIVFLLVAMAISVLSETTTTPPTSEDCFGAEGVVTTQSTLSLEDAYSTSKLEFTLSMFHLLFEVSGKRNLFFSPHSIHQALLMSFFGSKGATQEELRRALKLGLNDTKQDIAKDYMLENYLRVSLANCN
jgi:serine protease inhibitor